MYAVTKERVAYNAAFMTVDMRTSEGLKTLVSSIFHHKKKSKEGLKKINILYNIMVSYTLTVSYTEPIYSNVIRENIYRKHVVGRTKKK